MNGLKITTMTTEQMGIAREQGQSKTDWVSLHENLLNGIEPEEDEDSPDATILLHEAVKKRQNFKLNQEKNEDAHLDITLSANDFEILKRFAVKDGVNNCQTFVESIVLGYLQERLEMAG